MKETLNPRAVETKCAGCGHPRAEHIGIDGPCSVHRGAEFCDCDHFAPMRVPAAEV